MPEWMHNRAEHILAKNPSMPKGEAFAIATQQMHSLGKGPKGYGTSEGRETAKAKFDTPKDDQKVSNPGHLRSSKMEKESGVKDTVKKHGPLAGAFAAGALAHAVEHKIQRHHRLQHQLKYQREQEENPTDPVPYTGPKMEKKAMDPGLMSHLQGIAGAGPKLQGQISNVGQKLVGGQAGQVKSMARKGTLIQGMPAAPAPVQGHFQADPFAKAASVVVFRGFRDELVKILEAL